MSLTNRPKRGGSNQVEERSNCVEAVAKADEKMVRSIYENTHEPVLTAFAQAMKDPDRVW